MEPKTNRCLVVGIAGGTGSGKSTLARRIARRVGEDRCALLAQDNYYRDLAHLSAAARSRVNFDHPDSIDSELLVAHLRALKQGETVLTPRYDFSRHGRSPGGTELAAREVIVVEGILVLTWVELVAEMDIKIFVDTPDDIRLLRRVRRDIADRGRDVDGVLGQYHETVRPMHDLFVRPSRDRADLIVPGEGDNQVVVRFLSTAMRSFLAEPP
jgi:uridine kinase